MKINSLYMIAILGGIALFYSSLHAELSTQERAYLEQEVRKEQAVLDNLFKAGQKAGDLTYDAVVNKIAVMKTKLDESTQQNVGSLKTTQQNAIEEQIAQLQEKVRQLDSLGTPLKDLHYQRLLKSIEELKRKRAQIR